MLNIRNIFQSIITFAVLVLVAPKIIFAETLVFPVDSSATYSCVLDSADTSHSKLAIKRTDGKKLYGKIQWLAPEISKKVKALQLQIKLLKKNTDSKSKIKLTPKTSAHLMNSAVETTLFCSSPRP